MSATDKAFQRAVAALNERNFQDAEKQFRKVLEREPRHVAALNLITVALISLGRFADAEKTIARAVQVAPNSDVSFYNYGTISKHLGKPEQALAQFTKAIELNATVPETWNNRGTVLNDLRRYDEAIADFDRAIALNPRYADAFVNKARALSFLDRRDEALAAYDGALALRPDLTEAWLGRGHLLAAQSRHGEAFGAYAKVTALNPDVATAWLGQGNVLYEAIRHEEALAAFDRALAADPNLADAWLGRGNALLGLGRYSDAFAAFDRASTLRPDMQEALLGRGIGLRRLNRDAEALTCFDQAIALNPYFASAYLNKAWIKLLRGEYAEGWPLYEWRWKDPAQRSRARSCDRPQWLGDADIAGKTILIHAEQGLGDTIQFVRYLPLLAERKCRVVFEVQGALLTLFQGQDLGAELVARGGALPPFDYHCPLLSLPLAFGTDAGRIPARVPYLRADAAKVAAWKARLASDGARRIGLVWSGNPEFRYNLERSIGLTKLLRVVRPGGDWYALQKNLGEGDQARLAAAGVVDLSGEIADFADTAAIISELDLVITSDTSVAHLAGALGVPVWVLLSFHADFRWLRDREDSPWYPSARLFRQPVLGDWDDVTAKVAAALG